MRVNRVRKFAADESGFSLVFVGLGFMGFMAASMLAIDVGMLMSARSQAQNSADAGALAGATSLAFDDWYDRTPSGPAVVNAKATAKANLVQGGVPTVEDADIVFLNDPAGEPNRVQVTVHRTVNTLIAKYFGIETANINAVATGEASPANAMTCVKPFTIPDRWIEKNPVTKEWQSSDDFSRYDKKGNVLTPADVYEPAYLPPDYKVKNPNYSGYNSEKFRGEKLVLRASNGTKIQSSFYFSLAMTDDTGGDDYEWNIANCNKKIYRWNDPLVQEPGAKEGPTVQGIEALIAKDPDAVWDEGTKSVKNSKYGEGRQSPRIFPIPLYDPDYYDEGHQTGRVASLRTANWIGFFVEYVGAGSEIHGRIIPIGGIRDRTMTTGTADMPKAIRLVQ
ncbi:MAG TPA: pilus assembly protein TadG-related protein [Vicinamibacterales bacterium]|nr:pilus assembly protein TadG-related protein [Vicinamibacterales bacterium]